MALSSTQVAPDLLMGLLIRYYVFLTIPPSLAGRIGPVMAGWQKRRHVHALLFFAYALRLDVVLQSGDLRVFLF